MQAVAEIATSAGGSDEHNRAIRIAHLHYQQFMIAAAKLGLSPSDRTKVHNIASAGNASKKSRFFND